MQRNTRTQITIAVKERIYSIVGKDDCKNVLDCLFNDTCACFITRPSMQTLF